MNKKFLDRIYKPDLDLSTTQLYKEWAASYEDELNSNKYVTPRRCADMLMKYCANPRIKVLDLGCGTGLSGEALHARGFHQIDGLDLSSEMLTLAKEKAIYSKLINDDLNTLVKLDQIYNGMIGAGVISPGHANPETINVALSLLQSPGVFVFSLNDHALADSAFIKEVETILSSPSVEILEEEYGDHIIDINLKAKIFAIRNKHWNASKD